MKQADALCLYLKCLEELSAGNNEFLLAKTRLEKTLESRRSEEMDFYAGVCAELPFIAGWDRRGFSVNFSPGGGFTYPASILRSR